MKKNKTSNISQIMNRVLSLLIVITFTTNFSLSQEPAKTKKRHFSPEEFKAKQKEYIIEKAELTQTEADKFFPLFFELQKKKFELERNARKDINKKCRQEMSEEDCRKFVNNMAELKIEIAKLEKDYNDKYLETLPACKLMRIQRAELSFQRDLMKKMMRHRDKNEKKRQSKTTDDAE